MLAGPPSVLPPATSSAGSKAGWSGAPGRSATAVSLPTRAGSDMRGDHQHQDQVPRTFRPFAPSILEEAAAEYFVGLVPDPFMLQVYPVRPDKRHVIPAVTHVDGSGRLQTVNRRANPLYWRLITAFAELTGVPVLLKHVVQRRTNRSFTVRRGARLFPAHADGCAGY